MPIDSTDNLIMSSVGNELLVSVNRIVFIEPQIIHNCFSVTSVVLMHMIYGLVNTKLVVPMV